MVLWKETAFPLCIAMERHWKRNVVSRVSSGVVIRLPISCVSLMAISCQVPAVSIWQMGRRCMCWPIWSIVYLVLRCLLGCCTWFSCCAANVGLSICVWYCHVPGHWLSCGPWQEVPSGRLLLLLFVIACRWSVSPTRCKNVFYVFYFGNVFLRFWRFFYFPNVFI